MITDDAFGFILGRAKMREKAMRRVLELQDNGISTPKITRKLMKAYEDDFYSQLYDSAGNITDEANAVHTAAFVGCTYHCG